MTPILGILVAIACGLALVAVAIIVVLRIRPVYASHKAHAHAHRAGAHAGGPGQGHTYPHPGSAGTHIPLSQREMDECADMEGKFMSSSFGGGRGGHHEVGGPDVIPHGKGESIVH